MGTITARLAAIRAQLASQAQDDEPEPLTPAQVEKVTARLNVLLDEYGADVDAGLCTPTDLPWLDELKRWQDEKLKRYQHEHYSGATATA